MVGVGRHVSIGDPYQRVMRWRGLWTPDVESWTTWTAVCRVALTLIWATATRVGGGKNRRDREAGGHRDVLM